MTGSSDAMFAFRYPRFGNLGAVAAAAAIGVGWGAWRAVGGGARLETLLPWMAALVLLALGTYVMFTTFTPFAVDGKQVRVDGEGLQLGRFHLPAWHLGQVEVLDAETARVAAHRIGSLIRMRWEVEGRQISARHLAYPWEELPAVLIEDTRRSSRPWWMLAVPDGVDPEEFAAALRQVAAGRSERADG